MIFRSVALKLSLDDSPGFLDTQCGSNISIYHQYCRLHKRTDNPWFLLKLCNDKFENAADSSLRSGVSSVPCGSSLYR